MLYLTDPASPAFIAAGPLTFGFVVVGWIVGVCLHEYAHAVSAFREGDYMTRIRGYLTLDPLRYISKRMSFLLPLVILVLGGIPLPGAAVRIDLDALKGSRSQTIVALAGPVTTLALSIALFTLYALLSVGGPFVAPLRQAVGLLGFFNLIAFFINITPIPGLDGYMAIEPYLTGRWHHRIRRLSQKPLVSTLVLIVVVLLAIAVFAPLTHLIMVGAGVNETDLDEAMTQFRFWSQGL
ncbi:site-2 protease family protein [Asticcacaulis sp. YBE204]|uniref:site-2 protease family protein n=1 Tax=Asticcacaulis sp. YBE204 TaxID=1282363 RepID=UPI0003C3EC91|nr:site-2 protease family protein [Asticcacaulis sp. YBE204]ESQ80669.1 hypothetical protein AEYBE204_05200 [Asticcacaulis sp. YBE204]